MDSLAVGCPEGKENAPRGVSSPHDGKIPVPSPPGTLQRDDPYRMEVPAARATRRTDDSRTSNPSSNVLHAAARTASRATFMSRVTGDFRPRRRLTAPMLVPAGVPCPRCCVRLVPFLALAPSFFRLYVPCRPSLSTLLPSKTLHSRSPPCRHPPRWEPFPLAPIRSCALPRWCPSLCAPLSGSTAPYWRLSQVVRLPGVALPMFCPSLVATLPRGSPWRRARLDPPPLLASLAAGASRWWFLSLVLPIGRGTPLWWRPSLVVPIGVRRRLRPPLLASLHAGASRCGALPWCCPSLVAPLAAGAPP